MMSFEQRWVLAECRREEVIAAVLEVADRHDLRFWAHSDAEGIAVWVQFPIAGAAELACELSDLYTSPEEAGHELASLEGATRYTCSFELDWARDEAVVAATDEDNRAAWPVIVAFADAVVSVLGGEWIDP